MRTVSETSRTIINAPKFKLLAFQKINKGYDKICEEIIEENFPTIGKEISTQVQEAQRVPHSINPKINTTHILITLKKIKHKEKTLKPAKEKQKITYKAIPIRLTAHFSAETLQARESGRIYLK